MINSIAEITLGDSPSVVDVGERVALFTITDDGSTVDIEGSYDNETWEALESHTAAADTAQRLTSAHQWLRCVGTEGTVVKIICCDARSISSLGIY